MALAETMARVALVGQAAEVRFGARAGLEDEAARPVCAGCDLARAKYIGDTNLRVVGGIEDCGLGTDCGGQIVEDCLMAAELAPEDPPQAHLAFCGIATARSMAITIAGNRRFMGLPPSTET